MHLRLLGERTDNVFKPHMWMAHLFTNLSKSTICRSAVLDTKYNANDDPTEFVLEAHSYAMQSTHGMPACGQRGIG